MRPLFSIVTPLWNTPLDVLRDTAVSVKRQTFTDWEWIAVDDASTDPEPRRLFKAMAGFDHRIHLIERSVNGHIAAATNDGIWAARGEFIVLLDHDDTLELDALAQVAKTIKDNPDVDYIYTDEDKLSSDGRYYDPFRKPDWSPERLRGQNYASHLSVLRTSLVRAVGGLRSGFDGSQDHDLVLRVTEQARSVIHIPEILYHWRVVPGSAAGQVDAKPYAWDAGLKAVQDHLKRAGIRGTADYGRITGTYRIDRQPLEGVKASVIVPTRGGTGHVWGEERVLVLGTIKSLLAKAGSTPLEIVIVYDTSTPPGVLDELKAMVPQDLVLVPFAGPFNFSAKCNAGFTASTGEVTVMMNDDLDIISDGFIDALTGPLAEDDVGMTGARLLFSDKTIQHAGLSFSTKRLYHVFRGRSDEDPGPFCALTVNREASGLTGACVAMRREIYEAVGGMTEGLPVNFNDVDLSYKVRHIGKRLVWLADARAFHFESQTRDPVVNQWEADLVASRWRAPEYDLYLPEIDAKKHRRTAEE
ncbi:MAG: glycosyltransferase [Bifidobacteriaceae bacterium]|jgi:glycosyltransferase involved in cell wall biosynthesis|nr:glycosyltransferase [Bifidobacteriaceae bacterium]